MAPTSHQLAAAELALAEASKRLSDLVREARRDLERREAALLMASEEATAMATQAVVEQSLSAIREQAAADARREAATWLAGLIQARLASLQDAEHNSPTGRMLKLLLADVRGWAA